MTQQTPYGDADAFLMGGGVTSASFNNLGDFVQGTITEPPVSVQATDPATRELKHWPNGDKMMQLRVRLQTDRRETPEDNGIRDLYHAGSRDPASMSKTAAVLGAVKAAGADGLRVGGFLAVQFFEQLPPARPGLTGVKHYRASYTAPAPEADAFFGQQQPQQPAVQPMAPPPVQPAAPAMPGPQIGVQGFGAPVPGFAGQPNAQGQFGQPVAQQLLGAQPVQQQPVQQAPAYGQQLPGLAGGQPAPTVAAGPSQGDLQVAAQMIQGGQPDAVILASTSTLDTNVLAALRQRMNAGPGY